MKGSVPFEAVVPSTPVVGDDELAGEVDAAGAVEAAGADDFAGVTCFETCCALLTPLVLGAVFEVLLFVVELFVTELFVVLLLVTLVFDVWLTLFVFDADVDGVLGVLGVLVELHDAVLLKLFTACQSRQCRLVGHGWTMCGWLLPGPRSICPTPPRATTP